MLAAIKQLLATTFLTNAVVTYYTMAGANNNAYAQLTSFVIANQDSAAHAVTIHNVPSGGTAVNGNKIFGAVVIPANTTWVWNASGEGEAAVIPNGGTIQAFTDANSVVTLTLGGREGN